MELHKSFTNYRYQLEQTLDKLLALGVTDKEITIILSEDDYCELNHNFEFTQSSFSMYQSEMLEYMEYRNEQNVQQVSKYKFGPITVFFKIV